MIIEELSRNAIFIVGSGVASIIGLFITLYVMSVTHSTSKSLEDYISKTSFEESKEVLRKNMQNLIEEVQYASKIKQMNRALIVQNLSQLRVYNAVLNKTQKKDLKRIEKNLNQHSLTCKLKRKYHFILSNNYDEVVLTSISDDLYRLIASLGKPNPVETKENNNES